MSNNEPDKIRIPNEVFCPSKKIQFTNIMNNNSVNNASPYYNNNNNSLSNNADLKSNMANNLENINKSISPQNISLTNANISKSTNINLNLFYAQDNSSEEGVTISPIKSIVTCASSKPPTIIEPQCKLQKFLPPKTSQFHKTLVLDLDETLIHSYFDCPSPRPPDLSYDILIEKKKIHVNSMIRPGAREFLDNVSSIFEIVIFTASLSEYANPLLDFIDKNKICNFRLYREHCCSFSNGFSNSFTKDLKKLDRDMKNLLIVDNNPKSYMLNKENGIPIKTWVEDINDRELYRLIPYLIFLASEKVKDVRPFLKQVNSGSILNYEKFDKIISDFNIDSGRNKKEDNKTNDYNVNINSNNNNVNTIKEDKKIIESKNNKINNFIVKENKKNNEDINKNTENKKDFNNMNIIQINNIKENNKKVNKTPPKVTNNNIKDINKKPNKSPNKVNNNIKENNINKVYNNINENNTKINNNLNKINNNNINDNKKLNNNLNKAINNNVNDNKSNTNNNNNSKNNLNINEYNLKTNCEQINNEKNNKNNKSNKNKSTNNISYIINTNNKNYSPKRENMKLNKSNDKKIRVNEKNYKNNKYNTNNNININRLNQNINNSFNKKRINSTKKKKETNIKNNENYQKTKDSINNDIKNICERNNSVEDKNYCLNKLNEKNNNINNNKNLNVEKNNNKENNISIGNHCINNRYESFSKEGDNTGINEYSSNEIKNINNVIKIQKEVKKNNNEFRNFIFLSNSTQEIPLCKVNKTENNSINLIIHTTKSSNNINNLKNNIENLNTPNNRIINNELTTKTCDKNLIGKTRKDIINFSPSNPSELLNELITNLNNANSLKSSTTSITKTVQFSEEFQEKTIINDDNEEEEKNENKEKQIYEELFDDIDTERDDFNDSTLFNNKKNEDENNKKILNFKEAKKNLISENKKKCFEADDALDYNKSTEKDKLNEENIDNENNEDNTINTKGSINSKNRKINRNIFNKDRRYPNINNNKKNLSNSGKLHINDLFQNQYQSGSKNSLNNNKFLQPKKVMPKELFNYSTRKKNEYNQNSITPSNYKIFQEKFKSNFYLKNNSNGKTENIDSLITKSKPILKHNSNIFNEQNNQLFPKTNRNKNTYYENKKISLFKKDDFINNIKNLEIKSNNNHFYLLKQNDINSIEKKIKSKENNLFLNGSTSKIKRPTSCANKKSAKIFHNQKNDKTNKIIKLANQGKKIFLKTYNKSNKASINIENINNEKINLNDNKINNSHNTDEDRSYNNENKTNKNNHSIYPQATLSPSGNMIDEVFYGKVLGNQNLKTTKNKANTYINFSEIKEEKEKRFPSAMNNKLVKCDNKDILS